MVRSVIKIIIITRIITEIINIIIIIEAGGAVIKIIRNRQDNHYIVNEEMVVINHIKSG